jgi:hypothetical protein
MNGTTKPVAKTPAPPVVGSTKAAANTAAPSVIRQTQLLLLQKTAGITGGSCDEVGSKKILFIEDNPKLIAS